MSNTLSLAMIVKNEAAILARCLTPLKNIVDEIIVVDTGSEDLTKNIAKTFTHKVYDFPWVDDFAAARNFAFAKATGEHILWLDADDVITEPNAKKLQLLKNQLHHIDVVMAKYALHFNQDDIPDFWCYRERILRKNKFCKWEGAVHECIPPYGTIVYSDVTVEHRKSNNTNAQRNLKIYEKLEQKNHAFTPRELYYYGKELYEHGFSERAANKLKTFLNQPQGLKEDRISAARLLAHCEHNTEKAKALLLKTMDYGVPTAGVCCDLGAIYLNEKQRETAIFWYENALNGQSSHYGVVSEEERGYLPNIQLCLCHDQLGHYEIAEKYNEKALSLKPEDSAANYNKAYFKHRKKK